MTRSPSDVLADLAALATRQAALTAELARSLAEASAPAQAPASDAPEYLTTREAAAALGVSERHLKSLRSVGAGPRFVRVGRSVRYLRSALDHSATVRAPFALDGTLPFGVRPALRSR